MVGFCGFVYVAFELFLFASLVSLFYVFGFTDSISL